MTARYMPGIFDVAGLAQARAIILTPEGPGADTETRWAHETPYLTGLIQAQLGLQAGDVLLDFGCGVGRMAKPLIETTGCSVIGVDISPKMRTLAVAYVGSDRFIAVSPGQLDFMAGAGLRVQAAIAIWVLQHCLDPDEELARIERSLAQEGACFVLNMPKRAVPALVETGGTRSFAWASDSVDVAALLQARFAVEAAGVPGGPGVPPMADVGAFWIHLRRKAAPSEKFAARHKTCPPHSFG